MPNQPTLMQCPSVELRSSYGICCWLTKLPAGTQNFLLAPGISCWLREFPAGFGEFLLASGSSRGLPEVPAGFGEFLRARARPIFPDDGTNVKIFRFFRL